jgi:hypothetical protein
MEDTLHLPSEALKLLKRKPEIKLYFDQYGGIVKVSYKNKRKQTNKQESI